MPLETFREQVDRLTQMVADDGDTWDLSANDQAALRAVLANRDELLVALKDVTGRLERCMRVSGSDAEFAAIAVQPARDVIAKAEGR